MESIQSELNQANVSIEQMENTPVNGYIKYLNSEDELAVQVGLLNISEISSVEEAERIVEYLTGYSSETREYSAFLINRLMKHEMYRSYFSSFKIQESFLNAISDVNPKVCRKIMEILPLYVDLNKLFPLLIDNSFTYIDGLQEKNKNKNYQYNTLSFRLYWNIFAIGYCLNSQFFNTYSSKIVNLLKKLVEFKEYTLREKAAYLAQRAVEISSDEDIKKVISILKEDENFFVKEVFN